jgi:hypothetical protein
VGCKHKPKTPRTARRGTAVPDIAPFAWLGTELDVMTVSGLCCGGVSVAVATASVGITAEPTATGTVCGSTVTVEAFLAVVTNTVTVGVLVVADVVCELDLVVNVVANVKVERVVVETGEEGGVSSSSAVGVLVGVRVSPSIRRGVLILDEPSTDTPFSRSVGVSNVIPPTSRRLGILMLGGGAFRLP